MRKFLVIALIIMVRYSYPQTSFVNKPFERKGFAIGLGVGAGALTLNTSDTIQTNFSTTLPNIKVGYMLSNKFELFVLLPGANYKYNGQDRGFEGLILAGQYWATDKWWVMGGAGLTFDAPAFYTVKDPKTANFYTGFPAFSCATGFEVWHKGRFALDLQYRIFIGESNLPNNGQRAGVSNLFIVGFNWY